MVKITCPMFRSRLERIFAGVIRNGIGIRELDEFRISGVKVSIRASGTRKTAHFDSYLIVSFIAETRILTINDNDELEEAGVPGFSASSQTIEWAYFWKCNLPSHK